MNIVTRSGPRHLLRLDDFARGEIEGVLATADAIRAGRAPWPRLEGRVLGLCFFEPSTRTRVGFHVAAARGGGTTIEVTERRNAPRMSAPESLADTLRVVGDVCDALVLRHPDEAEAHGALRDVTVPVVSGGIGTRHHPTQALVDLYAIHRAFGRVEGLRIGMVGELRTSRSARSLLDALKLFPPSALRLMSPPEAAIPPHEFERSLHAVTSVTDTLDARGLDVLYVAGLPARGPDGPRPEAVRAGFRVTRAVANQLGGDGAILCPLPRIDEIAPEVDALPQARYFAQNRDAPMLRAQAVALGLAGFHAG